MLMKKYKLFFCLSVLCFFISGITILCVPITDIYGDGISRVMVYVVAGVFWIGIICGFALFFKTNSLRRLIERKNRSSDILTSPNSKIGAISFFKNREAGVCDVVLFLSALLFAILIIFKIDVEWLVIISATLLFLSFNLHCFLNGKNFIYLKSYKNNMGIEEDHKNE